MSGSGRSGADPVLVAALAAGATYEAAAEQAGVHERTVRRRMEDAAFRQQIDSLRSEMLAQAVAKLTASSTAAADTLHVLLGSQLDSVRLAAARCILELGAKLREHEDLAARVAALEERLTKGDQQWKPRTA